MIPADTKKMSMDLSGIFPPIPTPFKADGSLALHDLQRNLQYLVEQPINGVVVGGSNGEFVFLERDEKLEVVTFVREQLGSDFLMIAGAGVESTLATISLTKLLAEAGADLALILTPSYYTSKMSSKALTQHFSAIADQSPIPILLYNMPANTGVDIQASTICELAKHRNILGIKDSSGKLDKLAEIVQRAPVDFKVLAGSASFFLPALTVGAVGCIAALANIAAGKLTTIENLFREGELEKARAEQASLIRINALITQEYGVAGLKSAMDLLGLCGGPVRSPLLDLSDEERAQIREELIACELLESS